MTNAMIHGTRYVHTNLIARDWRGLASFYERLFDCVRVLPERHYSGATLEEGTGVKGASLEGIHLRLPGYGADGPTLEIFSYSFLDEHLKPAVNRPGFAHLAFKVTSVATARNQVIAEGGHPVGEIVIMPVAERQVKWCYVTDPEGNIIELQSWD